jgi:hypothetical protein
MKSIKLKSQPMKNIISSLLIATSALTLSLRAQTAEQQAGATANTSTSGESKKPARVLSANELEARKFLDEAKAKMLSFPAMSVDIEVARSCGTSSSQNFDRTGTIILQRPNKFRIEKIVGPMDETAKLIAVSDGQKVTRLADDYYVAYEKPVRAGSFYMGQNFMVQFFFDAGPIQFDPTDPIWQRTVSQFDKNYAAYDKDTQLKYLGKRSLEDVAYDVIEIRYNTNRTDIRMQVYLDADRLIGQVDTYAFGKSFYQKFRNYQTKFAEVGPGTFKLDKPEKMPLIESDPARLGETTPDFKLPGAKGEPAISLKELLAKGKGVFICSLNVEAGKRMGPDALLMDMKFVQEIKNKFEKQGLQVVVIWGGPILTPDLKGEMLLNWTPDISRFNYPIAIDIDVERGIQGSAYENFQLNGRNSLLLDKEGKVVFASFSMQEKSRQLALYQSLAQIGFTVSQNDLDEAAGH